MIIEMKDSMRLFNLVGLYEESIIPDVDYHQTFVSIGIIGGEGIDVYRSEWDEFVEKVNLADEEMEKSKQFYNERMYTLKKEKNNSEEK
jgi:hypothetical protein